MEIWATFYLWELRAVIDFVQWLGTTGSVDLRRANVWIGEPEPYWPPRGGDFDAYPVTVSVRDVIHTFYMLRDPGMTYPNYRPRSSAPGWLQAVYSNRWASFYRVHPSSVMRRRNPMPDGAQGWPLHKLIALSDAARSILGSDFEGTWIEVWEPAEFSAAHPDPYAAVIVDGQRVRIDGPRQPVDLVWLDRGEGRKVEGAGYSPEFVSRDGRNWFYDLGLFWS